MGDEIGWTVLARAADIVGLVAFMAAAAGIVSSVATRPRVRVQATGAANTLVVLVSYSKGSRAARNLNASLRGIDADGHATEGDDSVWRRSAFLPQDLHWINLVPDLGSRRSDAVSTWVEVKGPGLLLAITWDRPLLPWTRSRRCVLWTAAARESGQNPVILSGRKAARAASTSMTPTDLSTPVRSGP